MKTLAALVLVTLIAHRIAAQDETTAHENGA